MSDDYEYYQQRALVERSRAKSAPTPKIAAVHEELASLYDAFIRVSGRTEGSSNVSALPLPQERPQARSGTGSG